MLNRLRNFVIPLALTFSLPGGVETARDSVRDKVKCVVVCADVNEGRVVLDCEEHYKKRTRADVQKAFEDWNERPADEQTKCFEPLEKRLDVGEDEAGV
jgi:hypothetical protein